MRKSLLALIIVMAALSGACLESPQSAEEKWIKANHTEVHHLTDGVESLIASDISGYALTDCRNIDAAATKLLAQNPPAKLRSILMQLRHGGEVCSEHDSTGGIPPAALDHGFDLVRNGCESWSYEVGPKLEMECS